MRIRATHLEELLAEEMEIGNQLIPYDERPRINGDLMGLEALLRRRQIELNIERRRENIECWRDISQVLRDFLNAWENFSGQQAKQKFLQAIPKAPEIPQASPNYNDHSHETHLP